jgi:hypothetical protein
MSRHVLVGEVGARRRSAVARSHPWHRPRAGSLGYGARVHMYRSWAAKVARRWSWTGFLGGAYLFIQDSWMLP